MKFTIIALAAMAVVAQAILVEVEDGKIVRRLDDVPMKDYKPKPQTIVKGPGFVKYVEKRSREEIKAFWTKERMAAAIPLTMTVAGPDPNAAATCELDVESHTVDSFYDTPPGVAVGKVFFQQGIFTYVCSGSVSADNFVWTAGHCVYDNVKGRFSENFQFIPGYEDGDYDDGKYVATELFATQGWIDGSIGYDYALASMDGNVQAAVGGYNFQLSVNNEPDSTTYESYGYPAGAPFDGTIDHTCKSGGCGRDHFVSPPTVYIECDSTGGCSGGPWLIANSTAASGYNFGGLNSYNYGGSSRMYSPYLDSDTETFWHSVTGF